MKTISYDELSSLQEDLTAQVRANQVTRGNLRETYERFLDAVEGLNFPRDEAPSLFWSAVRQARGLEP